jgi:metal-responsive CopG/Arc/MetJ family transcriptional regulator
LLAKVDGFAESQQIARSEAVRQLIEAGLLARDAD